MLSRTARSDGRFSRGFLWTHKSVHITFLCARRIRRSGENSLERVSATLLRNRFDKELVPRDAIEKKSGKAGKRFVYRCVYFTSEKKQKTPAAL